MIINNKVVDLNNKTIISGTREFEIISYDKYKEKLELKEVNCSNSFQIPIKSFLGINSESINDSEEYAVFLSKLIILFSKKL